MNAIEKKIIKLLGEGVSQSSIAKQLEIPRSMVQRTQDKEMGVDPASLKSLTTEQISEIQKKNLEGASNASLASAYGVNSKTISRALLVRVVEQANNVTVISAIKETTEDGAIAAELEVLPGGVAMDADGTAWYVGAFLENHSQFLVMREEIEPYPRVKCKLFTRSDLSPMSLDSSNSGFTDSSVAPMAQLSEMLQGGKEENSGLEVLVELVSEPGEMFPIRGTLDARRRVGYYDATIKRTQRVSLSSVYFILESVEVDLDKVEKTSDKFGEKDLSVFLNEHQIMILPESVVIVIDGKPETVTTSHQSYNKIVEAIKNRDVKLAYTLMKPREAMAAFALGQVEVTKSSVKWAGHDISKTSISKRIMELMLRGDYPNLDRLTKFLDKMFQNPSSSLVQSGKIYDFMAYSDIEIDSDGDIILYKSVTGNYMDKHSRTINNTPGNIVRMSRSFVNDNNAQLCSYGLHVCSLAYLKQCFGALGQRVVRCKLNPKDIVSITNDYGNSKIRCCEYYVMDDYTTEYNRKHKSIDVEGLYRS